MKAHLGCGTKLLKGYINIDRQDFGQEVVGDAFEWLYMQPDNSLDEIKAEHFLEHFDQPTLRRCFALAKMKLKSGGTFVIVVPSVYRPEAYYFGHLSYFTEATFKMLEDEESCKNEGFPVWKIEQLILNNRKDIHCTLVNL